MADYIIEVGVVVTSVGVLAATRWLYRRWKTRPDGYSGDFF